MRSRLASFSAVRSMWRLTVGAVLLPRALWRARLQGPPPLISVDIFGTLVVRIGDDDRAQREGAIRCVEIACGQGLSGPVDAVALRLGVERRLSTEAIARGADPEFLHEYVVQEMLRELGALDCAPAAAREIAAWEFEREINNTRPVSAIADWVARCAQNGTRVVAVSDTRYSADSLGCLLQRHGIHGIATIYASADHGLSKFSGRLFDRVAELERVEPSSILHVGDNLLSDVLSASQRGLRVRRVHPTVKKHQAEAPAITSAQTDSAFVVGFNTLAPILVSFVRLMLDRARSDGVRRLAFVARDGDLPLQIARILVGASGGKEIYGDPELSYIHLSRRSVACAVPELHQLQEDAGAIGRLIDMLQSIRAMGTLLDSLQTYFGLPTDFVARHRERLRLADGGEQDVRRFLEDGVVVSELGQIVAPMHARLRQYLEHEQLLTRDTALVDIGWRGSIVAIVEREAEASGRPSPKGYLLGLWSESPAPVSRRAVGILCDQRRGRGLHEGAAWHAAFLLESVCRASHGIALGYEQSADGLVYPVCIEEGVTRNTERESEAVQDRIRAGILDYTRRWAEACTPVENESELRRQTQQQLFELAFFPGPLERRVGRSLVHSEPTSDERALALIADRGKGIRDWIAGLRSPWKGGYVSEHGGQVLATLYCVAEAVMSRVPQLKPILHRLLIGRDER